MKKTILTIALSLTAISSCFAATGHGYRILDSEIHSDPKFNFHVETIEPRKSISSIKSNGKIGSTITFVSPTIARVNESAQVNATHDFMISNDTNQKQIYEEYVSIDCDHMHNYFVEHVEIESGGTFSDSKHSFGTVQEGMVGSYEIYGETKLSGESSASSHASNFLTVNR